MYVIKQPTTKRFLAKEEDANFITLNLVYDQTAASRFTEDEAREVRDDAVANAKEQLQNLQVSRNIDQIEQESLTEFLNLVILEVKD